MRRCSLLMVVLLNVVFPSGFLAQAPEVTGTCVSGCPTNSGRETRGPSAAAERREERYNAAVDRYNKGMREAHDWFEKGRKASDHRRDLEALDLFRRAYAALLDVRTSNETSLENAKQRRILPYQEAIAWSEYNYALELGNQHDRNGAIRYFRQALNDYPSGGSARAKLQAALENAEKTEAAQLQQQHEVERQRIEALKFQAEEARMQNLLGAGRLYDQQLSVPSVDLDKPVDPGVFVTADLYQSANRKMGELRTVEGKLSAKIEELNDWRGDMLAQKREFDKLHAEAAHGELAEVIEVIPADAVFSHLLDRGMITVQSAKELKETFGRLKDAGKAVANTAEARNEKELIKVQVTATQDTIKELIEVSKDLPLDSPERLWDLRVVQALKMFGATGKAMLGEPKESTEWWERAEPAADLLADIGGIAVPPFAVAVNVERVLDREARKRIVARAQNNLGGAIADNWNAKVYLSQKLERVRSDMAETQRTITAYQARRNQEND